MQCLRIFCSFLAKGNNIFPPYKGGTQGGLDRNNASVRKKNLPRPLLRKEGRKKATVAFVRESLILDVFFVVRHCIRLTCYEKGQSRASDVNSAAQT